MIIHTVVLVYISALYHDHYRSPLTLIVPGNDNGFFHNDGERHHAFDYFEAGKPGLSKSKCTFLFTTKVPINSL